MGRSSFRTPIHLDPSCPSRIQNLFLSPSPNPNLDRSTSIHRRCTSFDAAIFVHPISLQHDEDDDDNELAVDDDDDDADPDADFKLGDAS